MKGDSELIYSKLSRRIVDGDVSVEVMIYRPENSLEWVLEVIDQEGGSTVWEDSFQTDEAALVEALAAIDEDGLSSFMQARGEPLH